MHIVAQCQLTSDHFNEKINFDAIYVMSENISHDMHYNYNRRFIAFFQELFWKIKPVVNSKIEIQRRLAFSEIGTRF